MQDNYQSGNVLKERYEIRELIGSGGMASTYLAVERGTSREVALKRLSLQNVNDVKELELFERETEALKRLDHPRIPDYIDNFTTDKGDLILVQEYVRGVDLFKLIKSGRTFLFPQAIKIFEDLLEILVYIHNLKPTVIHRDINPGNIVIDDNGKVFLVDFGAVCLPTDSQAASGSNTFIGTLGYMPPEQFYGKASPAADIYALGASILFLLTGREPADFELKKMKLAFSAYLDAPAYLQDLLDLMLEPDPDRRLQSAAEALKILKQKSDLRAVRFDTPSQTLTALTDAETAGDFERISTIINNIPDINVKDEHGRSLLKLLLDQGKLKLAAFLIKYGADVNARHKGRTLLQEAVVEDRPENAQLLLEHKADVNLKEEGSGLTALEYAYRQTSAGFKELLYRFGAECDFDKEKYCQFKTLPPPLRKVTFRFRLKLLADDTEPISTKYIVSIFFIITAGLGIGFLYAAIMEHKQFETSSFIIGYVMYIFACVMYYGLGNGVLFHKTISLLKKGYQADGKIYQKKTEYVYEQNLYYEYFDENRQQRKTGNLEVKGKTELEPGSLLPLLISSGTEEKSISIPDKYHFNGAAWDTRSKNLTVNMRNHLIWHIIYCLLYGPVMLGFTGLAAFGIYILLAG